MFQTARVWCKIVLASIYLTISSVYLSIYIMLFYLKKTLDLHCLETNDWTAWKCILKHALAMPLKGLNVECWIQSSSYMIVTTLIFKNDIDIILCHWLTLRQVEICSGEENESCIGRQTGEETYRILCQMGLYTRIAVMWGSTIKEQYSCTKQV